MRIAIVSGIDKPTTLDSKGGTEVWTAGFTSEEAKRGQTIELYAIQGSITGENITLIPTLAKPLAEYYADTYFSMSEREFAKRKEQFMATIYTKTLLLLKDKEKEYDVIIDSCSYPSFTANLSSFTTPTVSIQHFPVDFVSEYYAHILPMGTKNFTVFPSRHQYDLARFIPESQKTLIPHGIEPDAFSYSATGGESLLWMGRIHERMNKGVAEAIRVANETDHPLTVHATIEKSSEDFFAQKVEPLLTPNISFNPTPTVDKKTIYGSAKAFFFPIMWEEPFGLVFLEAMASGTPVIAFARGAVPEIVKDGVTGYIINPTDEDKRGDFVIKKAGVPGLIEAVNRLYALSPTEYEQMRKDCRRHIEEDFSLKKMVDQYEAYVKTILS
jgi:glycosyltransferase involved in cell wall biosynthesis